RHGALALLAPALALLLPHLVRHRWPGNVRELENVIERAAILFATAGGEAPTLDDLRAVAPELFDEPGLPASGEPPLRSARDQGERAVIERVLRECAGNQSAAARQLGIGRTTLWRKLRA
ncbi:MAG: helix-turn-helix domain-containing protein, partial [Anaeromyxobacteraceae bacterium]